jgi:hypothetical protein
MLEVRGRKLKPRCGPVKLNHRPNRDHDLLFMTETTAASSNKKVAKTYLPD